VIISGDEYLTGTLTGTGLGIAVGTRILERNH